jgi:predicted Fe-Mo cluster-binding NifX family protein
MRIAVPDWKGRVSPVFDVAQQVLVVDLEGERELRRTTQGLGQTLLPLKAEELARQGVNVLLCAGISAPLFRMLQAHGIQVVPGISGDVNQILEGYRTGNLSDGRFALPGWRGPGGRRHRGGRGGW